jgi:hypothetical protein
MLRRAKRARRAAPTPKATTRATTPSKRRRASPVTPERGSTPPPLLALEKDRAPFSPVTPLKRRPVPVDLGRAAPAAYGRLPYGFTFCGEEPTTPTTLSTRSGGLDGAGDEKPSLAVTFSRKNDPFGVPCLEPALPAAGPSSPVDEGDLQLPSPAPLFAEDWAARCSSPEL